MDTLPTSGRQPMRAQFRFPTVRITQPAGYFDRGQLLADTAFVPSRSYTPGKGRCFRSLDPRKTRMHWGGTSQSTSRASNLTGLIGQFRSPLSGENKRLADHVHRLCGEEALKFMAKYTPRLPAERWLPIAAFVEDAAAVAAPLTAYTASRIFQVLALYVDWCTNTAGFPLEARILFRRETIEHFIRNAPRNLGEGTLRNYRSMILRVSEVLLPEHNITAMRPLNGRTSVPPYSAVEEDRLRRWARGQSTELKERKAMLMLAFCSGAGLRTIEIAELRRGDVQFDDFGILVTIRDSNPRTVPLLAEWEPFARYALRDLHDDDLAFGISSRSSHRNLLSSFVSKSTGLERPRSDRLRATWLVKHLAAGTPMKALMQAAGVQKFENLARYLQYIPELDTREYRALLRLDVNS